MSAAQPFNALRPRLNALQQTAQVPAGLHGSHEAWDSSCSGWAALQHCAPQPG